MKLLIQNGKLVLPTYKVIVDGVTHWTTIKDISNMSITEVEEAEVVSIEDKFWSSTEYSRESEITNMPHDAIELYEKYIQTGVVETIIDGEELPLNHPFRLLSLNSTKEDSNVIGKVLGEVITEHSFNAELIAEILVRLDEIEKLIKGSGK